MANRYDALLAQFEGVMDFPSATPEQLNDIEARLGYTLPPDYREFLKDYGGYTFYDRMVYPVTTQAEGGQETIFLFYQGSSRESDIATCYSLTLESDTPSSIYPGLSQIQRETPEEEQWPPELLPIACDKGGNQICLALFGLRPGAIFFWVNAPGEGDQNVYLVANSFDEFMHLLQKAE